MYVSPASSDGARHGTERTTECLRRLTYHFSCRVPSLWCLRGTGHPVPQTISFSGTECRETGAESHGEGETRGDPSPLALFGLVSFVSCLEHVSGGCIWLKVCMVEIVTPAILIDGQTHRQTDSRTDRLTVIS